MRRDSHVCGGLVQYYQLPSIEFFVRQDLGWNHILTEKNATITNES